jgi:hypothetical protein
LSISWPPGGCGKFYGKESPRCKRVRTREHGPSPRESSHQR